MNRDNTKREVVYSNREFLADWSEYFAQPEAWVSSEICLVEDYWEKSDQHTLDIDFYFALSDSDDKVRFSDTIHIHDEGLDQEQIDRIDRHINALGTVYTKIGLYISALVEAKSKAQR